MSAAEFRSPQPALLHDVPLLADRPVGVGERWIYVAGFNVSAALSSTARIDVEVDDLRRLADSGARVALLSHQGDHTAGTASHLHHIAAYLSDRLDRPVGYEPSPVGPAAAERSACLRPGEIVLFGNTRFLPGEQRDDDELAARFAVLGDRVAVGGFSKAHRRNASTTGLLRRLDGYAAGSVVNEVHRLGPWAGVDERRHSVAVLGGVKPEKTLIGLAHLADVYDTVVVGGVVLNAVLAALGHDVGGSERGSRWQECVETARAVLDRPHRARIHVPREVLIARLPALAAAGGAARAHPVGEPVPAGHAIVDLLLEPWLRELLDRSGPTRALVAGPPARYVDGFRATTDTLLAAFARPGTDALLLGGDTVADLPWRGAVSTGGGSALWLLAYGTCPLLDALRARPVRMR